MDGIINNVLEGTRQYFLGLPKQAQAESSSQGGWITSGSPPEEGAPAQSGAPAASSRPPSAAASMPPRPPSEPLEPEPHIIHKATVMREAAEKRREQPSPEPDEDPPDALSPPSHIIRKPAPPAPLMLQSPAPAPAAPSPSPARPPSAAPEVPSLPPAPVRPPEPYSVTRPPEHFLRYQSESSLNDAGRNSTLASVASPQPSIPARQSPHSQQSYTRISSSMPQLAGARLRESTVQSPPVQRYMIPPAQPPLPHNDRVPPIHHPHMAPVQPRAGPIDSRSATIYSTLPHRHEPNASAYERVAIPYERNIPPRKYDSQQAYSGYRPTPVVPQAAQSHRIEPHAVQYKHPTVDSMSAHYVARPTDRLSASKSSHQPDIARMPPRSDYPNISRSVDSRRNYVYPSLSASTTRYAPSTSIPVIQNSNPSPRTTYRAVPLQKTNYEYPSSNNVPTSPARSAIKPSYPSQQARMTVSVTSLVNQMNQTKQKRESPLDLSVKTVKHSADSSTTQDDVVDSATVDNKAQTMPSRSSLSGRNPSHSSTGYIQQASHKVDFAPDFGQYRERTANNTYNQPGTHPVQPPLRYNSAYEVARPTDQYPTESRHPSYNDRCKYNILPRNDHVARIDLTRTSAEERPIERIRDDRHFIIEERKRPTGPIVSNIPEKIVRYETWTSDSRIDRMARSAREQHELMSQPVYSYSSHKRLEAYQNDIKRSTPVQTYREQNPQINHKYPYPTEVPHRKSTDYHAHHRERSLSSNNRSIIQKIPNHRDSQFNHIETNKSIPADKRVLSILRNSLEIKQTSCSETTRPNKIPDLIVIDDVDDPVIEITDENDSEISAKVPNKSLSHVDSFNRHIQMPKAIDSVPHDSDSRDLDQTESNESKSKSPENDVASRIRTKAELKVLPPSQDHSSGLETNMKMSQDTIKDKPLPKSQKQHLFNQIRADNLRLESVIKSENVNDSFITEIKSEPMNIEEIEKDAVMVNIKTENLLENLESDVKNPADDLDWSNACDSFMEQLKTGCSKKKGKRKNNDSIEQEAIVPTEKKDNFIIDENKEENLDSANEIHKILYVKQEPVDDDESLSNIASSQNISCVPMETLDDTNNKIDAKVGNSKNEPREDVKESKKPDKTSEPKNSKKSYRSIDSKKFNKNKFKSLQRKADDNRHEEIKNKSDKKRPKRSNSPTSSRKNLSKNKLKSEKKESRSHDSSDIPNKSPLKVPADEVVVKEESESTDDDEPLIKSKILKDKEKAKRLKYRILKDFTAKSAYVKLECCDVDLNKNTRISIDSLPKDKDEKQSKVKLTRKTSKLKGKPAIENINSDKHNTDTSSDSDDDVSVASRLRLRKTVKQEDSKSEEAKSNIKKSDKSPKKIDSSNSSYSTLIRKPGFGDGSDFHPGWEEELYRYKRSLRMPPRLIAIPRGRSGGPFVRGPGAMLNRGSTSLPDLDPVPLSPAPSSAPSAATDDLYARRTDKLILDSDLESNSSSSANINKLHYDSEASTSTVFSSTKKRGSSIVDVLMQKCGKRDNNKKKNKEKGDKTPSVAKKSSNTNELLATPSLGLIKDTKKEVLCAKKDKLMEDIFYLGAFRKETVAAFRNDFIKNTDGLIGATEEFAPVVLKTRTRTESRVLKQRATIKEVFGDDRPASAPPTSCRNDDEDADEPLIEIKKNPDSKPKLKPRKILKDKFKRRSSSIRDGLRSTKSLKMNDAKGRLMRLKKRNNLMMSLANKRLKDLNGKKSKKEINSDLKPKLIEEGGSVDRIEGNPKRRFKRLFGRRKFSSGFDYIRKKKKLIRREDGPNRIRRPANKPSPESVHDIQKEIKGWFINKSIGETHLHRAARLGYTDCVAYCLEKLEAEPSAKDNAGFTPLHVAAANGHVRIARLLLQYGANVSAAAQGGIRPLHEACENGHVEVIRLLLAYGADPLLGTYADQTPQELAEGQAATLLRLHIADVQGLAVEPWRFASPAEIIDREELGCDPLRSPPPPPPSPAPSDVTLEMQCSDAPLPPFYSLRPTPGQPNDGLWCLLQDITNLLQIKSKESLLKQIHSGAGSPKELFRELRTTEFLERAQCHQLLCAGEKVNVRASKVALVRLTDKLRTLLNIETVILAAN